MELTAILSSGSNIEFEWIMSENDSTWIECVGIVRECKTYYNYTTTGHFRITLVATNDASYRVRPNIAVDVFNPVIGFELILASPLINGSGSAEFTLTLDSNEKLPMGNISLSIDYGDGTYELLPLNETFKAQLTISISHVYSKQGEFTTVAYVSSALSTQHLTNLTVKVWDDISSLSLSIPAFANVSEAVHFEFKNYLAYGFEFLIEYDDGDTLETTPDVLNNVFDTTPWTHAYSSPKVYEVKLAAWNPAFAVASKYNITIQYPITDLSITPAPTPVIKYPIPDGYIEFTITQIDNHNAPTDVTCYFSFENGEVSKTENVDISYGQQLHTSFTYTTSGVKDINITCINEVSMYTVLTTINVLEVQLEDYTFTYPVMPSVNTSLDANNKLELFSLDIQFDISLLNCSKFPVGDSLSFKFEDGTVYHVSGFQFVHRFTKRGIFKILVTISNSTTFISKELQIKIGKVDFTANKYAAGVKMSTVTFNISGPATGGTYDIFTAKVSFRNLLSSSNPIYQDYKYKYYGIFYPYVVANFPTFTEIVHIDKPIYVDYNLSAIEINFNTTIELPPGDLTVTVSKHELSDDLPSVKCVFDFGDQIDRTPREVTQDITEDSPLTYNFTYLTLGYQHANVTCFNNYDRNENVAIITVQNECFPMTGIFDRQYSNSSNPLKLITSQDVDLSSRMPVKCADKDVIYDWRMYRVFNNTNEPFNHTPPEQPLGSMRYPMGSVPQGIYRITLNVSLPETYISEPTYVQFIKLPPFALIDGGSQRQATAATPIVMMDALTHSYDLELGYGGNQNLIFEWSCQRYL